MAEQTFTVDGTYSFVVPTGVVSVRAHCYGGQGAGYGKAGDYASATLPVTAGETLTIGIGAYSGGFADVRRGTLKANRLIVAGGGGSSGWGAVSGDLGYTGGESAGSPGGPPAGAGTDASGSTPGGPGLSGGGTFGPGGSPPSGPDATWGMGAAGASASAAGYTAEAGYVSAAASGGKGGDGHAGGGGGGASAGLGGSFGGYAYSDRGGNGSSWTGTGTTPVINTGARLGPAMVHLEWLVIPNDPPNAPLLLSPASGEVLSSTADVVFQWQFSDPNTGDVQSRWELEVRRIGIPTPLVVDQDVSSAVQAWTESAATFTAGDYEYRVLTYDSAPLVGSWTGWRPFSLVTPPPAPVITAPANLAVITTGSATVTWTHATQEVYEVRRVTHATTTVLWTSGPTTSTTTRSLVVGFPVNGSSEDVQVRVMVNGVWSTWATVWVTVTYLPPMTPTVVVTAQHVGGFIRLDITKPTPTGGAPTTTRLDVYVRVAAGGRADEDRPVGGDGIRIAANVGDVYFDYAAASGVVYEYRVQAIASNITTAWSTWIPTTLHLQALHINDATTMADNVAVWLGEETEKLDTAVEVRHYGGGRRRSITRPGADRTVGFEVAHLARATLRSLRDKIGRQVLVRAPRGAKVWGIIGALSVTERANRDEVAVSFEVTQITHHEAI
jgi:hypothetical protein